MRQVVLMFAFIGISLSAYSQNEEPGYLKNEVSFSPVRSLFSELKLAYEYHFSEKFSMYVSPSFIYRDFNSIQKTGGSLVFQPRYYAKPNRFIRRNGRQGGLYFAPILKFKYLNDQGQNSYYDPWLGVTDISHNNDNYIYGIGIIMGFKTIYSNNIVIDFSFGSLAQTVDGKMAKNHNNGVFDDAFSGVRPYGNISFGFLF